jgi:hypothetical protein
MIGSRALAIHCLVCYAAAAAAASCAVADRVVCTHQSAAGVVCVSFHMAAAAAHMPQYTRHKLSCCEGGWSAAGLRSAYLQ